MNIFSRKKEFNSLDDLLVESLADLYDAEHRIAEALPEMVESASSPELKRALEKHIKETEGQIARLEKAFRILGLEPEREECEATKGILQEARGMATAKGSPEVRDAAIISAAQRVEHYEIASYGSARNFAQKSGFHEIAQLCEETLEEEKRTDKLLTNLAVGSVNEKAQHAAMSM